MEYDLHAYILEAIRSLRKSGSWTGRTHVQKTLALVSAIVGADLPFSFVLYKHGPYSFEVNDEIDRMISYDALRSIPQGTYGPTLEPGDGECFTDAFGEGNQSALELIPKVAAYVGSRNVVSLEALATATWIRTRENVDDDLQVQNRLAELKPHLPIEIIEVGVRDSKAFLSQCGT